MVDDTREMLRGLGCDPCDRPDPSVGTCRVSGLVPSDLTGKRFPDMPLAMDKLTFPKPISFARIANIAIPLMLTQVVFQLQGLVNRAFLGNLGSENLTIVTNATFPFFAVVTVFWSLGTGLAILVGQRRGAGDDREASRLVETALPFFFGLGVVATWAFQLWSLPIMQLFAPPAEYAAAIAKYVQILSPWFLVLPVEVAFTAFLQARGTTRPLLWFGIVRVVLNVAFDALLIFGVGPIPALGVEGSAWASLFATVITDAFLVGWVLLKQGDWGLHLGGIVRPSGSRFWSVAQVGIPTSLENIVWFTGTLVLLALLNTLGPTVTGIFGLVFLLEVFPGQMHDGLGRSATTIVSEQIGASEPQNARKGAFRTMLSSLGLSSVFAVLFVAWPREILGVFTQDVALIDQSVPYLWLASFTVFVRGGNIVIGGAIRGMGDTPWMLGTQIAGSSVFVIGLSYALAHVLGWGLWGVFVALAADETCRFVANVIRFELASRRRMVQG